MDPTTLLITYSSNQNRLLQEPPQPLHATAVSDSSTSATDSISAMFEPDELLSFISDAPLLDTELDWLADVALTFLHRSNHNGDADMALLFNFSGNAPSLVLAVEELLALYLCVTSLVRATFENVGRWLRQLLRDYTDPNIVVMLIGNKSDLRHLVAIPLEDGKSFSKNVSLYFMDFCIGRNQCGSSFC
ncbi:ras-related protein RABA6a-like [Eucalyptus grandis]|uniref:ras-related protein RABA6a-like n=1 Tax=Eucalyptus grandis TaxID=71139 RepID=UPI00192EF5DE|nr:ras-related protein RABA6a-like [Eucalyptus grandis]